MSESVSQFLPFALARSSSVSTGERIGTSYCLSFQYIDRTYFLSFYLSFDMASVAFFPMRLFSFLSLSLSLPTSPFLCLLNNWKKGRMSYEREHMNELNKKKSLFPTPFSFVLLCHWLFVPRCAHRGIKARSIAAMIERRIGSIANTNTYLLSLLLLS